MWLEKGERKTGFLRASHACVCSPLQHMTSILLLCYNIVAFSQGIFRSSRALFNVTHIFAKPIFTGFLQYCILNFPISRQENTLSPRAYIYSQGPSINDVYKILPIFEPPPRLLLVILEPTPLENYIFQPKPPLFSVQINQLSLMFRTIVGEFLLQKDIESKGAQEIMKVPMKKNF